MKPLVIHANAEAELHDAVAYYEQQRSGLGLDFQSEVEAGLRRIQQNPLLFPLYTDRRFRKCFVNRFPYTIYFIERDIDIWVAAVAHQGRRPGYWIGRAPDS